MPSSNLTQELLERHHNSMRGALNLVVWIPLIAFLTVVFIVRTRETIEHLDLALVLAIVLCMAAALYVRLRAISIRYAGTLVSLCLIAFGLIGYLFLGASSAALPAATVGLLALQIFASGKTNAIALVLVIITLFAKAGWTQDLAPAIVDTDLQNYLSGPQNWALALAWIVALSLMFLVSRPFRVIANDIRSKLRQTSESNEVSRKTASALSDIFFSLSRAATIELNGGNSIVSASSNASRYLGDFTLEATLITQTKLASLPLMNLLLHRNAEQETPFSLLEYPSGLNSSPIRITMTPLKARSGSMHKLITITDVPLSSSAIKRDDILDFFRGASDWHGEEFKWHAIAYVQHNAEGLEDKANALWSIRHIQGLPAEIRSSIFFLTKSRFVIWLSAKTSGSLLNAQSYWRSMQLDDTTQTVSVGWVMSQNARTQMRELLIKSQAALEKSLQQQPGSLVDHSKRANLGSDPELRARLAGAIESNEFRASFDPYLKADKNLRNARDFHLTWPSSPYPELAYAGPLLGALVDCGLASAVPSISPNNVLAQLNESTEAWPDDSHIIALPDNWVLVKNAPETLAGFTHQIAHPEKVYFRVTENAFNQLGSAELNKLLSNPNLAERFILGHAGSGLTNMQLLSQPAFAFIHFGTQLVSSALSDTQAKAVLKHLLRMVARLNKRSIAKIQSNDPRVHEILFELGFDYVDPN